MKEIESRNEIRKNFYKELQMRYLEGYDTIELPEKWCEPIYRSKRLNDCTFFKSEAFPYFRDKLEETPILEVMKELLEEEKCVCSLLYERLETLEREGLFWVRSDEYRQREIHEGNGE